MNHAACGALLLACALAGCGAQPYRPQPLSPEATAGQFHARSPDDLSVRAFLEEHGARTEPWPLKSWGVTELTLLAVHFHPDLDAARASVEVFRAGIDAAAIPAVPSVKPLLENHSKADAGQSRWTYGVALELPLTASGKREARVEQARARLESARAALTASLWEVASRVRRRLANLLHAGLEVELARQESELRAAETAAARRRLEAGAANAAEVVQAQQRLERASLRLEHARAGVERGRASLADAIGVPSEVVQGLHLDFTGIEFLPAPPAPAAAREAALQRRADLRRALLSYDEADAALKLAVANQYPDLQITPGYLWDQGDRVWLLGLAIPLQMLQDRSPLVREAEARRELEARNFAALQAKTISDVDDSLVSYRAATGAVRVAERLEQAARERSLRAERALAAGAADRGEVLAAGAALIEAEGERLNAMAAAQGARFDLEDAMQQRLTADAVTPGKAAGTGSPESPW